MNGRARETEVPAGVPCAACGYTLAGLPLGSLCPECALPVEHSLSPGLLRFADRRWLGRVADGLRRQHAAMRWMLGATVGAVALGAVLSLDRPAMFVGLVAVPLEIITAANVRSFGAKPIALPGGGAGRVRSRFALRATAIAHAIGVSLGLAASLVSPAFETAWTIARYGLVINGVVMLIALLLVLEDLERRTAVWDPTRVKLFIAALIMILIGAGAAVSGVVGSSALPGWSGGGLSVLLLMLTPLVGRVAGAVADEARAAANRSVSTRGPAEPTRP